VGYEPAKPRLPLFTLLVACPSPEPAPPAEAACAWSTSASASVLAGGYWVPEGPESLARHGDALLANPHAAFVIQKPEELRT